MKFLIAHFIQYTVRLKFILYLKDHTKIKFRIYYNLEVVFIHVVDLKLIHIVCDNIRYYIRFSRENLKIKVVKSVLKCQNARGFY